MGHDKKEDTEDTCWELRESLGHKQMDVVLVFVNQHMFIMPYDNVLPCTCPLLLNKERTPSGRITAKAVPTRRPAPNMETSCILA